jgi:protease I
MTAPQGTIGVLIEEHFDAAEFRRFNEYFPAHGFQVEYLSHLWGQPSLTFGSNAEDGRVAEHVTVSVEVNDVDPAKYSALLLIGGYAMDRLRYEAKVRKGQRNESPGVRFLRQAVAANVLIGTICHALWLFCAAPELLRGRRVTCAHNIIADVQNAGAEIVFEGDETAELVIEGNIISARHPAGVDSFMDAIALAILTRRSAPA